MKKVLSIIFLLNLLFLGCLNEVEPEFGILRLKTSWPEFLDNQLLEKINQINVRIEPGSMSYTYDSLKSQFEIDCELGIYNINVKAIDDSDKVLFSADTGKILVEPFTTKDLLMAMVPAFPHLPPKFADLERTNLTNTGNYTIKWHPSNKATQYKLIESNDSLFNEYVTAYTGPDTAKEFSKTHQKSYYYKLKAKNEIGSSPRSDWITMTFQTDPLEIITDTLPTGKIEELYEAIIIAAGGISPYSYQIINGNLPDGLTLNGETGLIFGVPTIAGTSIFTIQIADNGDPQQIDSKEFTITIDPADLTITTTSFADGKVGNPYSQTFSASGGVEPYTWSITSGSLPEGLSLDSETGEISGTPTTAGTSTVTIQVADNGDPQQTDSKEFTILINPADLAITTSSLTVGKVGDAYSQTLTATGGTEPYTWSITSGSLPEGLSLDAETGEISGTPTTVSSSMFTIQVADNSDPQQQNSKEFTINIDPADLTITTNSLPDGKVGDTYTQTFSASGGVEPYTWSITTGSLPEGLSLDSETGEISGTPTTAGTSTFTIQVADNGDPQQTDSKEFTILINPADLTITTSSLTVGKVGDAYSQTLTATGGTEPYTWSITSGSLPEGLTLDAETGEISGTPTTAGTSTVTIQAADNGDPQQTDSKEFTINIDPADLTITTTTLTDGKVGDTYSQTLTATGGTKPYTWSISNGSLPEGLMLDNETGEISGTPTTAGSSTFTIQAADNGDPQQTDSKEFIITTDPADLTITTTSFADGKVSDAYSQTLSASGGVEPYIWSIASSSLPDGLTLDSETGEISGTPTTAGSSAFTVQVADNGDPQAVDTKNFTLTINPEDLIITTRSLADGKVNDEYSHLLIATGGATPYTWSIVSGYPPDGLTLNTETGEIYGTPTTIGKSNFTIMVSDAGDPEQTHKKRFSLTVKPGDLVITSSDLPIAEVGIDYSQMLSAAGGTAPITWSVINGVLPGGLTLDAETGEIYGTPTSAGTSTFTIQVADNGDPQQTDNKEFTISVEIADLVITTNELSNGKVDKAYSQTLTATGGITPYHWLISSGSLPAGLSLNNESGEISGSPTTIGTSTFTIAVTGNNDPPKSNSKEFTIIIDPADLTITTSSLPQGEVGSNYSQFIAVTGGISPYNWSVKNGSLPGGLSLDENTGEISGKPGADGSSTFTIQVSDNGDPQQTDDKQFTITIEKAALSISTNSLADGKVGDVYSKTLSATGGTTPYTWSISSGSLPDGLTLDGGTGEISGTPTTAGSSTFTIQVTDNGNPQQTDTKQFTITISTANLAITTSSLPNGTAGEYYSYQLQSSGGIAPYTWTELSRTNIPEGITIKNDSISGNPNNQPQEGTIEVQVSDSDSPVQTDTKTFSLTIEAGELELFSAYLPEGTVDVDYWGTIDYRYGTAPLLTPYTITGDIPEGITLDYGNLGYQIKFTGAPTEGGTYNFTITVKDSGSPQQTRTDSFTITINP